MDEQVSLVDELGSEEEPKPDEDPRGREDEEDSPSK
jgi:hypothetical protein